jgi:hypothetical protein
MSITQSEFVFVALVVQHVIRMRHIAICGLSGPTIFCTIFCTISHNWQDFRKQNLLNMKCVL